MRLGHQWRIDAIQATGQSCSCPWRSPRRFRIARPVFRSANFNLAHRVTIDRPATACASYCAAAPLRSVSIGENKIARSISASRDARSETYPAAPRDHACHTYGVVGLVSQMPLPTKYSIHNTTVVVTPSSVLLAILLSGEAQASSPHARP